MKKLGTVLVHAVMLAIVCAIAAHWAIKLLTPPPSAPPPPVAATPPRDPDPVLAARMFGLVQAPSQVASNVQIAGVFAAGKDSAAILIVDGKPPRVYLIGQDVTPGLKLVDVRPEGVSLENSSGRQELQIPLRQVASLSVGGPPAAPAFTIENNMMTAPSQPGGAAPPPTVRPVSPPAFQPPQQPAGAPQPAPPQNIPQIPPVPPNVPGAPGAGDMPVQPQPPQSQPSQPQQPAQGPQPPRPPPGALRRAPATN